MIKIPTHFAGQNHVSAPAFKRFSQKFFTVAVSVDVRRVKKINAPVHGRLNGPQGFRIVGFAVAVAAYGPATEAYFRNFKMGASEFPAFHRISNARAQNLSP